MLLARVIGDLADDGASALDYGFGHACYKERHATEHWEDRAVHLYASTPRGRTAMLTRHVADAGRRSVRAIARHVDLARRIKRMPRRRAAGDQA